MRDSDFAHIFMMGPNWKYFLMYVLSHIYQVYNELKVGQGAFTYDVRFLDRYLGKVASDFTK